MTRFEWMEAPDQIPNDNIAARHSADIVIIGAGHAGTAAARAASEGGASVIVIEQQTEDKQWILGVGEIGHINSKWQKEQGLPEVHLDEFLDDWQLRTGNRSNYRLIRKYAENCGECFDWFISPLSDEDKALIRPMMTPPSPNFAYQLNGLKSWPGSANMGVDLQNKAVKASQRLAKDHGARFFFGTKAVNLVKEGARVSGVIAQLPDGAYIECSAGRGVILAAGDYSRNAEMCRDLLTEADDLIAEGDYTGHGWDGSGIRMGIWAGGKLEPRSHAAMGGNYSFPGFDLIGSTATLRVNSHGRRYSNEGFGTHILAAIPGAKQPDGFLWGIFDSTIVEEVTYQAANHAAFDYTDEREEHKLRVALKKADEARDAGSAADIRDKAGAVRPLYSANTLKELAEKLFTEKKERTAFLQSVSRYNELCDKGHDDDFGKDARLLHPIRKAPFYACGNWKNSHQPGGQSLKILVTVSGLMIDENGQVLGENFEPIPGLYAAGNCSGCRFGAQYSTSLPGQSISIAQTLGRELGKELAAKDMED